MVDEGLLLSGEGILPQQFARGYVHRAHRIERARWRCLRRSTGRAGADRKQSAQMTPRRCPANFHARLTFPRDGSGATLAEEPPVQAATVAVMITSRIT